MGGSLFAKYGQQIRHISALPKAQREMPAGFHPPAHIYNGLRLSKEP
jgi:hypothetical protein